MKTCPEPVQYGKEHNFGAYHYRVRHMDKPALKICCVSAIFSPARITTCRDGKFMVTLGGRPGEYLAKSKNEGMLCQGNLLAFFNILRKLSKKILTLIKYSWIQMIWSRYQKKKQRKNRD